MTKRGLAKIDVLVFLSVFIRLIRGSQTKRPCVASRMAELTPFGGITRIRFKGSAPKQFGALSATRLPRTFFLAQNKTDTSEVNDEQLQAVCYGRWTNPQSSL
jgi:hypothetical protein